MLCLFFCSLSGTNNSWVECMSLLCNLVKGCWSLWPLLKELCAHVSPCHSTSWSSLLCPSLRPINPQRPSQPFLHPNLSQPQSPHRLPHSRCASSRPISAPCSGAAVRPQPTTASAAGCKGVPAECQAAQRVKVWRAQHQQHQFSCLPSQQGQETEAQLSQCQRALGCQAAEERPPKNYQWLASSWPALSERGFLRGM